MIEQFRREVFSVPVDQPQALKANDTPRDDRDCLRIVSPLSDETLT